MKTNQKGFTLIELLVVIAIIGILAALVLVALGNARDKANDARIKSDIGQLRTIAEIIYDSNSTSYETVEECFTAATANVANCGSQSTADSVSTLLADISTANGGTAATVGSDPDEFCVAGRMKSGATFTCVDHRGVTKSELTAVTCNDTGGDIDCD